MKPFTLIGLPGAGKSSVTAYLAQETGKTVVSTDVCFAGICADLDHPVTQSYLAHFKQEHGQAYDVTVLSSTAQMINTYGNETFRDFEQQAIEYMFQSGMMYHAIPDLGGAAFMREATRQTLNNAGIVSIYIDASPDFIVPNLVKDYEEAKKLGYSRRGNYFDTAQKAEENGQSPQEALAQFSQQHRLTRDAIYSLADITLPVDVGDTIENIASRIKLALSDNSQTHKTPGQVAGARF